MPELIIAMSCPPAQVFVAFTVAAHNSMPWLTKGKPHPGRPDMLILDAPLWHHWPQLLVWLPFEASILYLISAWADSKPLARAVLPVCSSNMF